MRADASIIARSCRDEELPPTAAKAGQRGLVFSTHSISGVRAGQQETPWSVSNARL